MEYSHSEKNIESDYYVEHKFQQQLKSRYSVTIGSSASGIDLPSKDILTDIKVTSIKQPQSSCPYKDAKQKIFGLGYNLLVFVYEKIDNAKTKTTTLHFVSCAFISSERTADYTTTYRLREMIKDNANEDDIIAYLTDRNIPADEITLQSTAKMILENPPKQGYCVFGVTISSSRNVSPCVILKVDPGGNCPIMERLSNGFHESLANSK